MLQEDPVGVTSGRIDYPDYLSQEGWGKLKEAVGSVITFGSIPEGLSKSEQLNLIKENIRSDDAVQTEILSLNEEVHNIIKGYIDNVKTSHQALEKTLDQTENKKLNNKLSELEASLKQQQEAIEKYKKSLRFAFKNIVTLGAHGREKSSRLQWMEEFRKK